MTTDSARWIADLTTHGAWARRLAARLLSPDDPDDLVQETWMTLSRAPRPAGASPRQWLGGVMRNLARLRRRAHQRREARERDTGALLHTAGGARPDELAEQLEAQQHLAACVLALAPIYRDVILLRYYDDLSTAEVAARLAIPPGTARRRLSMALQQLRADVDAAGSARGRDAHRGLLVLAGGVPRAAAATPAPVVLSAAGGALALVALLLVVVPRAGDAASSPSRAERTTGAGPVNERPPHFTPEAPRQSGLALAAGDDVPASFAPGDGAALTEAPARHKIPLGSGPFRGPPDAKVTILEFVDYQCPFTARAEPAVRALLERHPKDVRLQVVHRPFGFHPQAELLARAALAADAQGRLWPMHDRLITRPRELWTPALVTEQARQLGLDLARFEADLAGEAVRARLAVDEATATGAGVDGVPVFVVNGRVFVGRTAPAAIEAVLADEVARADALIAKGARAEDIYNLVVASGTDAPLTAEARRPAEPADQPRRGWEGILSSTGTCMPPLAAPTALDFAMNTDASGRRASAWGLIAANSERYSVSYHRQEKRVSLTSTTAAPDDFVAEHQTVLADDYRGKRVRFRAEIKGEDIGELTRWAGLWMRVEDDKERVVVSGRAPLLPGDRGWHAAEVVLAIPADAKAFAYGLVLAGRGTASVRNVAVEVVAP